MKHLFFANWLLMEGPGPAPGRGWEWHYYWMGGWWGLVAFLLVMILFWGLIIGGIALLVRFIVSGGRRKTPDAMEILKQRYARGEIERAEFEEKRNDLIS